MGETSSSSSSSQPKVKAPPQRSTEPLLGSKFQTEAKSGFKVPVASMPPEQAAAKEKVPSILEPIARIAKWYSKLKAGMTMLLKVCGLPKELIGLTAQPTENFGELINRVQHCLNRVICENQIVGLGSFFAATPAEIATRIQNDYTAEFAEFNSKLNLPGDDELDGKTVLVDLMDSLGAIDKSNSSNYMRALFETVNGIDGSRDFDIIIERVTRGATMKTFYEKLKLFYTRLHAGLPTGGNTFDSADLLAAEESKLTFRIW